MLERVLSTDLLSFFLVFSRLGAAMMLLPGFGETFVAPRVRLLLALCLAAICTPVVAPALPQLSSGLDMIALLLTEIGVGLFIGTAARMLTSALQTAGTVIAFQISLSSAFVFDPASGQQNAVTASFLSTMGLVLLFVTDLHHLLLRGLIESYSIFIPGSLPPLGDFVDTITRITAKSFRVGIQLAAPFVLIGVLLSVGLGLLSRLMPQIQIFSIAIPVQLLTGFLAMLLTVSYGMTWFLGVFEDGFSRMFLAS